MILATYFLFILSAALIILTSGENDKQIDPIKKQIDQEVAKVLKISTGPKRIGGPGFGFGSGGIPGGWSKGDPNSKDVIAVANFACEKLFPNLHPAPRVSAVMTQVVAGLNYNLTMSVTRLVKVGSISTACSIVNVNVWDRFGTYNLMKNSTIASRCYK